MINHCHYNCCDISKIVNTIKTITITCDTNIQQPLEISENISVLEVPRTICTEFVLNNREQFQNPENVTVTDDTITFTSQGYTIRVPLCNMKYIVK